MINRFPFLLIVLFIIGCGHSPSLIGRWKSDFRNIALTLDFKNDGTLTGQGSFRDLTVDVKGKYTFDGHQLSYDILSAEPAAATANPMLLAAAAYAKTLSDSGHLEWKNENEFILTNRRGIAVPFDRVGRTGGE